MYKITYVHNGSTTENILYEPGSKEHSLTECELNLEVKKSGDLMVTVPSCNPARDDVVCLTDEVIFYRKNVELWRGRIVTKQEDFYKYGTLECEGCLSYFCDTVYEPFEYEGSVSQLFSDIIMNHNINVDNHKKFQVGTCTVTDPNNNIVRSSEKPLKSLEMLNNKLQNSALGGYMKVRVQGGTKYLDYIQDYSDNATQDVVFGQNLIDVSKKVSYASVVTAIMPIGAKSDDEYDEDNELISEGTYLTVESVNNGSPIIKDETAIGKYGFICDWVEFSDITEPQNLLSKGRAYLQTLINPIQTLEVTFYDMALISDQSRSFYLGDHILVNSSPHGINQRLMLTSMKVLPLAPENSTLKFGSSQSITDEINRNNNNIEDMLDQERKDRHSAYEALQRALAEGEGMFISYEEDSEGGKTYYMHNNKNLEDSEYVIKVNSQAIGFSTDGGKTYQYGMTIDGDLVMKIIEAEGLRADWIYFTNQETQEKGDKLVDVIAQLIIDNGQISSTVQEVQRVQSGGVGKVETEYYLSTSSTTQTGGSWSTTVPTAAQMKGKFVWTRTKTSYLDTTKTPTYSTPVCITGTDGDKGADGRGISALQPQYAFSDSNTTAPAENSTSWKNGSPTEAEITSTTNANKYIWSRTKISYDDGTTGYTTPTVSAEWQQIKKMSSEISQLSNAITMTVKYDNDPNKGGKLRLGENSSGTGVAFTVNSTNFRLDENGVTEIGKDADWFEVSAEGLVGYRRRNTFTFKLPHNRTGLSLYLIGFSVTGNSSTYSVERTGRELQKEFLEKIKTRNTNITNVTFDSQRGDGYAYLSIETKDLTVTNIAQLMKVGTTVSSFTLTVADRPLGNGTLLLPLNGTSSNITTTLSSKVSTGTVIKYDSIKTDEVRAKRLYSNGNLIGDRYSAATIDYQTLDAASRKQVCSITFPQAGTYLVSFKLKFATASTSGNGTCLGWASNNSDCDSASAIAGSNCGIFHNSSDPYTISATFPWTVYSNTEPLYIFARATLRRGMDGNVVVTGIG